MFFLFFGFFSHLTPIYFPPAVQGGAQEFFNCDCDVVCYGKTLGGGLPCGVICGPSRFLNRSGSDSPLQKAIVIGTFSSHPIVMSTMSQFLDWAGADDSEGSVAQECRAKYTRINKVTDDWVKATNAKFDEAGVPVLLVNVGSIWGIRYKRPGRYHWMFQYFILDEGFKLASIGTGRMNLSLDTTDEELEKLAAGLLRASRRMQDGGWWSDQATIKTTGAVFKALAADAVRTWLGRISAEVGSWFGGSRHNVAEAAAAEGKTK